MARTQAGGGGRLLSRGAEGNPEYPSWTAGSVENPKPERGRDPPQPPQWIGLGVFPGVCLHAGRFHAAAGGMMLNPPDLARRHRPGASGPPAPSPAPPPPTP